jgi:hypothetical protein
MTSYWPLTGTSWENTITVLLNMDRRESTLLYQYWTEPWPGFQSGSRAEPAAWDSLQQTTGCHRSGAEIQIILDSIGVVEHLYKIVEIVERTLSIDETYRFLIDIPEEIGFIVTFGDLHIVVKSIDSGKVGGKGDIRGASGEFGIQIGAFIAAHQLVLPKITDLPHSIGGNNHTVDFIIMDALDTITDQILAFALADVIQIGENPVELHGIIYQVSREYPA